MAGESGDLFAVVSVGTGRPVIMDAGDVLSRHTVLAGGSRRWCEGWIEENIYDCPACGAWLSYSHTCDCQREPTFHHPPSEML
jgi:hypothetical protein